MRITILGQGYRFRNFFFLRKENIRGQQNFYKILVIINKRISAEHIEKA